MSWSRIRSNCVRKCNRFDSRKKKGEKFLMRACTGNANCPKIRPPWLFPLTASMSDPLVYWVGLPHHCPTVQYNALDSPKRILAPAAPMEPVDFSGLLADPLLGPLLQDVMQGFQNRPTLDQNQSDNDEESTYVPKRAKHISAVDADDAQLYRRGLQLADPNASFKAQLSAELRALKQRHQQELDNLRREARQSSERYVIDQEKELRDLHFEKEQLAQILAKPRSDSQAQASAERKRKLMAFGATMIQNMKLLKEAQECRPGRVDVYKGLPAHLRR
eukprot:Gregarina_sp_Poly_1__1208@NODE_1298_length_4457_cov_159_361048_g878_i0_p4_GENE_NODE_1298_length_4457_cov_159_361048_g878_i0NODE_1298_length_4457_cov_159_361048_g878_i0_p4_ORF_typecomplete_len276_score29_93PKK/PF12474_8/0_00087PKK/PF12474_8/49FAM184/PF15665_5/0_015GEMIN8/PF15348_6/6_9FUSC/PF04632_12/5_5_NODE_1298_length_4457_cov_159_361048_g878_i011611988